MSSVNSTETLHHSIPLLFKGKSAHRSWPQLPEELVRSVSCTMSQSGDRFSTTYPGLSRTIIYGTSRLPVIVHLLGMLANSGIPGWSIHVYATRSNSRKVSCRCVQNGAERVSDLLFLLFWLQFRDHSVPYLFEIVIGSIPILSAQHFVTTIWLRYNGGTITRFF